MLQARILINLFTYLLTYLLVVTRTEEIGSTDQLYDSDRA